MRLMRFGLRTTRRDRPVGKGRERVNPSPGFVGDRGCWSAGWIYALDGLKASADFNDFDASAEPKIV